MGPYRELKFNEPVPYTGQKLQMGIYTVHIRRMSPTLYPLLFTKINGEHTPCIARNCTMKVTSAELDYLSKCEEYEIYLIDALISLQCGTPLKDFMQEMYEGRSNTKKLMKQATSADEHSRLNSKQLLQKLCMNALYGKFGASSTNHFV